MEKFSQLLDMLNRKKFLNKQWATNPNNKPILQAKRKSKRFACGVVYIRNFVGQKTMLSVL